MAHPTLADVFHARRTLAPYLRPTPVLEPHTLCEALGFHTVLKCEHLNPTGAFKVRGGINLIAGLPPSLRERGVAAASTGNHAQSVAYAARLFGVPATIYMPERANPLKVEATRALGATVVLEGADFDGARAACAQRAERDGLRFVRSIEPPIIAGVATGALELLETAPDLDVLIVSVGGGSGVLGAGLVARAVNPAIRIIGVQAEGAPAIYESWRAGHRVVTERAVTFAEGLATREPFALTLELLPKLVDDLVLVSDLEIAHAIRMLMETARQVIEGAGAASLAAAVKLRRELVGRRVGLMLSGGNITADQLRRILDHQAPEPVQECAGVGAYL